MTNLQALVDPICDLATAAGQIVMQYYHAGDQTMSMKADNSPVTQADLAAHQQIVNVLSQLTPDVPVISEENESHPDISNLAYFWMVDPIDGTKSFLNRTGDFTVNIALIEEYAPVFGVIFAPVQGTLYYGSPKFGTYRQPANDAPRRVMVRPQPPEGFTAITSSLHPSQETEQFLQTIPIANRMNMSSSLKFCAVAEGTADIYPRMGRTMEWDTAAGQAILTGAGGKVIVEGGLPLTYRKQGLANPYFIALGGDKVEQPVAQTS